MHNFQIALDRDDGKIDYRTVDTPPDKSIAENQHAEPVASGASKVHIAKMHRVNCDQEKATEKIEDILMDNQHVFLVLFWSHQSVEDQPIGRCSNNSSDKYEQLEIELDTTWRPGRYDVTLCNSRLLRGCQGNGQVRHARVVVVCLFSVQRRSTLYLQNIYTVSGKVSNTSKLRKKLQHITYKQSRLLISHLQCTCNFDHKVTFKFQKTTVFIALRFWP